MKKFTKVAAQGELTIIRLGPLPKKPDLKGYKPMPADNDRFIVGHSETGHHHVIEKARNEVYVADTAPEGMRILKALINDTTSLDHLREHDTHEALLLEPGEYEIRIAREFNPYT